MTSLHLADPTDYKHKPDARGRGANCRQSGPLSGSSPSRSASSSTWPRRHAVSQGAWSVSTRDAVSTPVDVERIYGMLTNSSNRRDQLGPKRALPTIWSLIWSRRHNTRLRMGAAGALLRSAGKSSRLPERPSGTSTTGGKGSQSHWSYGS